MATSERARARQTGALAGEGLREVIRRAFAEHAGRTALVTDRRATSFGELADRVFRLSTLFRSLGAGAEDTIGFITSARPEHLYEIRLATLEHGATLFPMSPLLPLDVLRTMLASVSPRLVVYDPTFLPEFPRLLEETLPGARAIALAGPKGDYEGLLEGILPEKSREPIRPEGLTGIFFTSGTTGAPKGITATHGALCESSRMFLEILEDVGAEPGGALLNAIPLFSAGGGMIVPALAAGLALHVSDRWDPAGALALLEKERIEFTFVTPSMILDLLDQPLERHDLSALRGIVYGSSPIPAARLAEAVRRLGSVFLQGYGMSECFPPVTVLWPEDHGTRECPSDRETLASAGKPYPGIGVRIDAPGADGIGEVLILSPTVTAGYWNDPERTAQSLSNGWFRSGDIGFFDPAGRLHVLDRKQDVIQRRGRRVFPRTIEEAAAENPMVKEVCAVAAPGSDWIVAAVSLRAPWRGHAEAARRALPEWLASRLSPEDLPDEVRIFDELPRSVQGKVLKREIREALRAGGR